MIRNTFLSLLLVIAVAPGVEGALLTVPDSSQIAYPGSTIGWSFTLESDAVFDSVVGQQIVPWILVTSADWVLDPATPPPGIFTPFITQFPNSNTIIGPDTGNGEVNPWSQTFNLTLATGIGSYAVNDPVAFGTYIGLIQLTYDLFRVSPNSLNFDPATDTMAVGQLITHAATIRVDDPQPTTDVPEPGGPALFAAALAALLVLRILESRR
jgi:hypothetical protein